MQDIILRNFINNEKYYNTFYSEKIQFDYRTFEIQIFKKKTQKTFFPPAFLYDLDSRDSFGFDFGESF